MIIFGRSLSPFTRKILIWATLQDRGFEQRPIQVVGEDYETLRTIHPGARVPVVELADGTRLVDSAAIIDYFEFTAPIEARLLPQEERGRREAARLVGHARAACEKAVAYFYELNRRPEPYRWMDWAERAADQTRGSLRELEAAAPEVGFFGGVRPNGVDIPAVVLVDFLQTTSPALIDTGSPKLTAMAARANALPAFSASHPKNM